LIELKPKFAYLLGESLTENAFSGRLKAVFEKAISSLTVAQDIDKLTVNRSILTYTV